MSFNFSVPTNALFGAGKLSELHTQINSSMGAVHGKRHWLLSLMVNLPGLTDIWTDWKTN